MKNTIVMMGWILMCVATSVKAQQAWDPMKNPTVDSIRAKYEGKLVVGKPAPTLEEVFPVLGQYQSVDKVDASAVSITLDEMNKGIVWISGLPQGKMKAMLKKSPATYRIPPQAAEDGKQIPEGTLIYDKDANLLSICLGKKFNEPDPASVFLPQPEEPTAAEMAPVKGKTKSLSAVKKENELKPWVYTAHKIEKPVLAKQ